MVDVGEVEVGDGPFLAHLLNILSSTSPVCGGVSKLGDFCGGSWVGLCEL